MRPSSAAPPRRRTGAIALALAGLLIGLGGLAHPRVESGVEHEEGLAGMFASSAWDASHLLTMAGFATLAAALVVLVRAGGDWPAPVRLLAWIAAGAAGFAALESVPHLLAATELDALRRGDATPLADLHTTLQAVSTPVVGLSFAALAVVGARTRTLDGGRIATALAVVGGLAFALAGPAIALTQSSEPSPLFAGSAGLAVWAAVTGTRLARRRSAVALVPVAGEAR